MKKKRLKTKITIKTDNKYHFILSLYELWHDRYRSAMITASQFTAALPLSQSDGDFEPSVEVFQQPASYADRKEPKINQLVKGTKTREVKTIDTCRGKNSDQKMGEFIIQSPEQIESTIVRSNKASDSWNQHVIFHTSAVIVWSPVSVLQHSTKQKTLVVAAENFR